MILSETFMDVEEVIVDFNKYILELVDCYSRLYFTKTIILISAKEKLRDCRNFVVSLRLALIDPVQRGLDSISGRF